MSADLSLLDLDVRVKALRLKALAAKRGIEIEITQTTRTFNQQASLYAQGRSIKGKKITNAPPGWSSHNWCRGFDIAIKKFPGDITPKDWYDGPWEIVGTIGETLGLSWGGRWKNPDRPHFDDMAGLTFNELMQLFPQGI